MPSFKLLPTFWAFNRTTLFVIGTRFSTTSMLKKNQEEMVSMAKRVVEFSSGVYKIGNIFA
jgi:hypothetical protein